MHKSADPSLSRHRSRLRAYWRAFITATALVLAGIFFVAVALYLSLTDEHLTRWTQSRLEALWHTPVHLRAQMNLARGATITDIHVGPIPHTRIDAIVAERLYGRFRLWDLLRRQLTLTDVQMDGLEVWAHAGVDTSQGQSPQPKPPSGATSPSTTPEPELQNPDKAKPWPVKLILQGLQVHLRALHLHLPDGSTELSGDTHFTGVLTTEGTSWTSEVVLLAGDPHKPMELVVTHGAVVVRADIASSIAVQSTGPDDVRLQATVHADTTLHDGTHPSLHTPVDIAMQLAANFPTGTCALQNMEVRLSESTTAQLTLLAENLRTHPSIQVQRADIHADLHGLEPFANLWMAGVALQGHVQVHVEPMDDGPQTSAQLRTATLEMQGVSLQSSAFRVAALQAKAVAQVSDDSVAWHADLKADSWEKATWGGAASKFHLETAGTGPLWGLESDDLLPVSFVLRAWAEQWTQGAGKDLRWALSDAYAAATGGAPVGFAPPFSADVAVQAEAVSTALLDGEAVALNGSLRLESLGPWQVAGSIGGHAGHLRHVAEAPHVTFADVFYHLQGRASAAAMAVEKLTFNASNVISLQAQGQVAQQESGDLRIHDVQAHLNVAGLDKLQGLMPPDERLEWRLTGGALQADLEAEGNLAWNELVGALRSASEPADTLAVGAAKASTALQLLASRFQTGLPLQALARIRSAPATIAWPDGSRRLIGVRLFAEARMQAHGPTVQASFDIERADEGAQHAAGLHSETDWRVNGGQLHWSWNSSLETLQMAPDLPSLHQLTADLAGSYQVGGDVVLEHLNLVAADLGTHLHAEGLLAHPLASMARGAWQEVGLPGIESRLHWQVDFSAPPQGLLGYPELRLQGSLRTVGTLTLDNGHLDLSGNVQSHALSLQFGTFILEDLQGELPFDIGLSFGAAPDHVPIMHHAPIGGGMVALQVATEDIRNRPARPIYYDRLRPYRPKQGLLARRLSTGPYEVLDFALEGRLQDGMLLGDWIAMNVLGGDVVGDVALQLGADNTVRASMTFKVSNLDASYFPQLALKPGPESELSADLQVRLLFGESRRDVGLNVDVTKLGATALDRFLRLLDPDGKDAKLQQTRGNLRYVRIRELALWLAYENLNMDMIYDPLMRIPFTDIGYRPIERELLRRYSVAETLDVSLQPLINRTLGPLLGWSTDD